MSSGQSATMKATIKPVGVEGIDDEDSMFLFSAGGHIVACHGESWEVCIEPWFKAKQNAAVQNFTQPTPT